MQFRIAMQSILLSIFAAGIFPGFTSNPLEDEVRQVEKIQPNPKMPLKEAEQVARLYFLYRFGGCGAYGQPLDKGTYWQFSTRIGYADTAGPSIFVEKATGMVSCPPGPSFKSPKALANAVIEKAASAK